MTDLLTIPDIAAMLKTTDGVALQVMGNTPFVYLGKGKGKGRRYRRVDVLAVIQGRVVDPSPKAKADPVDEFWTLPRKERLARLRN